MYFAWEEKMKLERQEVNVKRKILSFSMNSHCSSHLQRDGIRRRVFGK